MKSFFFHPAAALPHAAASQLLLDPRAHRPKRLAHILGLLLASASLTACDITSVFSSLTQQRGMSGFFTDNRIRVRASVFFNEHPDFEHVQIMVHRGQALLMGRVKDEDAKIRAETKVKSLPDVVSVLNHIQVSTQSISSWAQDVALSEKLRRALTFDLNILSQNFHVCVVERVVYILGTAQNQREVRYVLGHADGLPVLNVVHYITVVPPAPVSPLPTSTPTQPRAAS